LFAAAGAALLAVALATTYVVETRLKDTIPCPDLPRRTAPAQIHLVPGFSRHQSWIEFRLPQDRPANVVVLCRDGWYQDVLPRPAASDYVRFNVSTLWVNLHWLRRQLRTHPEDEPRWEMADLVCTPGDNYSPCA
jgi:hypothetical protein